MNKERLLIDFCCGLYAYFLAPIVVKSIKQTVYATEISSATMVLGVFLILLNILEIYVVAPKLNKIYYSIEDKNQRLYKSIILILFLFLHAGIGILSIILAFQLVGLDFSNHPFILAVSIAFIGLKEFFLIKNTFARTPVKLLLPFMSNLVIALYSCLIYTIFWDATNSETHSKNLALFILELIPMGLFFAFFYYPLRIPFVFHSIVYKTTRKDKVIAFVSFLLVFIPAALNKL
jgi:hypothetical protein